MKTNRMNRRVARLERQVGSEPILSEEVKEWLAIQIYAVESLNRMTDAESDRVVDDYFYSMEWLDRTEDGEEWPDELERKAQAAHEGVAKYAAEMDVSKLDGKTINLINEWYSKQQSLMDAELDNIISKVYGKRDNHE